MGCREGHLGMHRQCTVGCLGEWVQWDVQGKDQRWEKGGSVVVWGGKSMEKEREKGVKGTRNQVAGQYACVAVPCA